MQMAPHYNRKNLTQNNLPQSLPVRTEMEWEKIFLIIRFFHWIFKTLGSVAGWGSGGGVYLKGLLILLTIIGSV